MKTIKNSVSMKILLTAIIAFTYAGFVNGQFQTPTPDSPITQALEEVRTGTTTTYSLSATHNAGETYRWEVTGGQITEIDGVAFGPAAVVDFTADAHTITVNWNQAPASAIASVSAQIQVQKSNGSCPSQVTTLPVNIWNDASATITTATADLCSGDSPVANVAVALTGAPDGTTDGFAVDYSFTIPAGLSALDSGGNPVAASGTVPTDGATVNIPLPATLINTTGGDLDFVVNLDRMNDDFTGDGAVSGTYTVTVHPVPVTGTIVSGTSLTRR